MVVILQHIHTLNHHIHFKKPMLYKLNIYNLFLSIIPQIGGREGETATGPPILFNTPCITFHEKNTRNGKAQDHIWVKKITDHRSRACNVVFKITLYLLL